jgi:hypothetical protein
MSIDQDIGKGHPGGAVKQLPAQRHLAEHIGCRLGGCFAVDRMAGGSRSATVSF